MRTLATAALLLFALVVGACGQSSSRPGAAALVPADVVIYGELTLDPEGDEEQAVRDIAARFPGGDDLPAQIDKGLTRAFEEEGLDYAKDIEPWLGDRAVFFVTELKEGDDPPGAVALETDDEQATLKALEKLAEDEGPAKKRSYEGTDVYEADDVAYAVLEGSVVVGTPSAVRASIDTAEGGESLEDSERATEALERFDDPLAAVYFDGEQAVESLGPAAAAAAGPFVKVLEEQYVLAVSAESDAVVIDSTIPPAVAQLALPFLTGSGTEGLAELPGDAWVAGGQPELGKSLKRLLEFAAQSESFDADVEGQVKAATGLDLEDDLLAWMGDLTFFVRGTSLDQLGGGLAIETSDPDASRRALEAIERLVARQASDGEKVGPLAVDGAEEGFTFTSPESPQRGHVALSEDRVIAAFGDEAAEDLLDPSETLADNEDFTAAGDRLGDGFATGSYIDIATVLDLVENVGAGSSPEYQEAKPYLEPFVRVVAGTKEDGDEVLSRTRIELR